MNLRSRCTRAFSLPLFTSLTTKLRSSRVLQGATLGLCGTLALGVAGASRLHHVIPSRVAHRHHAALRHSLAARDVASAGVASGNLISPAANLDAVLQGGVASALSAQSAALTEGPNAPRYELHMHHLHTGEDIDVVYRIGNYYIPSAIAKLNYFLRDHRTMDVSHYDPREFDLLHSVLATLGRPGSVIDIVCGYRTPWSNNFLRTRSASTGVAKNSQHMQAKAIDIRIPGVATSRLRDIALSLHGGGVGYYPVSQFVHVDVGPVRQWSFGGRGE